MINAHDLQDNTAPDITLTEAGGDQRPLASWRGSWVVLYFYPKASTPGCTREARDFTDHKAAFAAEGCIIAGVSPDSTKALCTFISRQELEVTLLSDRERAAARAYGAFGIKKMYGKEVEGIIRSTYLIDPAGVVRRVWSPVKVDGHAEEVLAALKECKRS